MSADNYLYVTRRGEDEYVVLHLSASMEYEAADLAKKRPVITTGSLDSALAKAYAEARENYYEYGVDLDAELSRELEARA